MRGVIARTARREGRSDTEIAAAVACDAKALRRAEADVQRLERAEGTATPSIPHDPKDFQTLAYARRALSRAFATQAFEGRVQQLERAQREGRETSSLEASIAGIEAGLRLHAGLFGRAFAKATGKAPISALDPDANLGRWAALIVSWIHPRRRGEQASRMKLDADTRKQVLNHEHSDEILRMVEEQERETRSEKARQFRMPGAGSDTSAPFER
jgi:hypothetical protein